jgi:hypothetical protein
MGWVQQGGGARWHPMMRVAAVNGEMLGFLRQTNFRGLHQEI